MDLFQVGGDRLLSATHAYTGMYLAIQDFNRKNTLFNNFFCAKKSFYSKRKWRFPLFITLDIIWARALTCYTVNPDWLWSMMKLVG